MANQVDLPDSHTSRTETVKDMARQAKDRVDRAARYLRNSDLLGFRREAENFARRQPNLFLGGSLAAGVLLARFLKSSAGRGEDRHDGREEEDRGRLGVAVDAVKDAAGSARDLAVQARDRVSDLASQAGGKLGEVTGKVKEQATDLTGRVRGQASELGEKVHRGSRRARLGFWQVVEERPLVVGAATLAVGFLAGLAIPSTRAEDELMGETRDQLLDSVKETGREVVDEVVERGKQVAKAAVDAVTVQPAVEEPELVRR